MKCIKALLSKLFFGENGNISVLLCLGMAALIGMAAFAVDAGMMYLTKNRLTNTIDAAMLAGAHDLPGDPAEALQKAQAYVELNELEDVTANFQVGADGMTITGTGQVNLDLFFFRVFGLNSQLINASSYARVGAASAVNGIVPFGVGDHPYTFGDLVEIKYAPPNNDTLTPGWFGALALGGGGASIYEDNITNGYWNTVRIGDVLPVETGVMAGPTKQGIQARIDACPHAPKCAISSYVEGCPRIMIVPLGYNTAGSGSNVDFIVTGFAAFLLDDSSQNGNGGDVSGRFIRYMVPGETSSTAPDRGVYSAQLYDPSV